MILSYDSYRPSPNTTSDVMLRSSHRHRPTPLNPTICNLNSIFKLSYASVLNPTSIFNPYAPPRSRKSFLDAVTGSVSLTILVMPALLHRSEPAVLF